MGSIYGVFSQADKAPLDSLPAMSKSLQHRVHDHSWGWADQFCAMGAAFLHITPGSEHEKAPPAQAVQSQYVIACDSRIDNRDELISHFQLPDEITCDSDLILSLFRLLGDECLEHLLGAFAFAIYDRQSQTMFCARDHFGEKPLSYAFTDKVFAFASEPCGVIASGVVEASLNEGRILSLLALNPSDVSSTVYENVVRLPGAHALKITKDGLRVWQYWKPQLDAINIRGTDDEVAAQFISLLRTAVYCRLRSTKPVGACLSGGLDSSTIVMLAREAVGRFSPCNKLTTFSGTFPSVPGSDEEQWIETVENAPRPDLAPLMTSRHQMDIISPIAHTADIVAAIDEPVIAPNLFQLCELAQQARAKGIGVLLGGHDGDTVVSHGFALLTELALAGDWARFAEELQLLSAFLGSYGGASRALVAQYAVPCVKHLLKTGAPVKAWRTARILHDDHGVSWRSLFGSIAPMLLKRAARRWHIAHGRLGLLQLATRARAAREYQNSLPISSDSWRPSAAEDHLHGIDTPLIAESFEFFDRIGARIGVEYRHPFFDKRLVDFCLSLPLRHKVRQGWTRMILREATKGILPDPVRLRRDKSNLGENLAVSLVHDTDKLANVFADPPPGFSRFWDSGKLEKTLMMYRERPNGMDAYVLLLAYSHAVWLGGKTGLPQFIVTKE